MIFTPDEGMNVIRCFVESSQALGDAGFRISSYTLSDTKNICQNILPSFSQLRFKSDLCLKKTKRKNDLSINI